MKKLVCPNANCLKFGKGLKLHGSPILERKEVVQRVKCINCGKTFSLRNWERRCKKRGVKEDLTSKDRKDFKKDEHYLFVQVIKKIMSHTDESFYDCAASILACDKKKLRNTFSRGGQFITYRSCEMVFRLYKEIIFIKIDDLNSDREPKKILEVRKLYEELQEIADLIAKFKAHNFSNNCLKT